MEEFFFDCRGLAGVCPEAWVSQYLLNFQQGFESLVQSFNDLGIGLIGMAGSFQF